MDRGEHHVSDGSIHKLQNRFRILYSMSKRRANMEMKIDFRILINDRGKGRVIIENKIGEKKSKD